MFKALLMGKQMSPLRARLWYHWEKSGKYLHLNVARVEAMRAAGPWRQYAGADPVITRVIERFGACKSLRHLEIRRNDDGLVLQRG